MAPERTRTAVSTTIVGLLAVALIGLAASKLHLWVGIGTAVVVLLALGLVMRRVYQTGPHTEWTEARDLVERGHAVVLWKPTCGYCERLLRAVGKNPRVTWVNVWADPAANQAVRDLNDGNELTPTALVGEEVLRNPTAAELVARLGPR